MKKWNLGSVICLVFSLSCLVFPAAAGTGASSGVEFLKLGAGARPLAMGDAYTGLADDSAAIFYNPAGLANLNFPEVMTMYNKYLVDSLQQAAGIVYPTRYGIIGVGYSGFNSGDIQGYDQNGAATTVFTTGSSCLTLALGRQFNPALSYGISLKQVSEKLADNSASALAADAGLFYRINQNVTAGLAATNLGAGLKFISDNTPFPTAYRGGLAFSGRLYGDAVNLTGDLVSYADGTKMNFGAEYVLRNLLSLRAGLSGNSLRAGLGVSANLFSLDYAYLGHQDLGAAHQVSVSLLFGAPDQAKKLILENLAYGKAFIKEEKYADAIVSLDRVLAVDPQNEEANLLVKKAQNELDNQALAQVFTQKEVEIKRSAGEIIASGKKFYDQGKYIEAVGEFGNALKIDPTNAEALRLQNQAQNKMETQLIEQSRTEAKEYLGEAMKLVITGKYAEALAPLNKALEKDPKNKQALELKKKLELIQKIQTK
ncbi:MAG: PorV/PorQ family protein [Candidatus Margulisiibacteriota bacterium]